MTVPQTILLFIPHSSSAHIIIAPCWNLHQVMLENLFRGQIWISEEHYKKATNKQTNSIKQTFKQTSFTMQFVQGLVQLILNFWTGNFPVNVHQSAKESWGEISLLHHSCPNKCIRLIQIFAWWPGPALIFIGWRESIVLMENRLSVLTCTQVFSLRLVYLTFLVTHACLCQPTQHWHCTAGLKTSFLQMLLQAGHFPIYRLEELYLTLVRATKYFG